LRWFREVRNQCLKDKLDGQEFFDTNQLLQCVLPTKNCAKSSRFRDSPNKDEEKHHINFMDEEANDDEGNEICVVEWVEKPGDKPLSCSFLKPNGGWREEMRHTFDVSKCDCLFDLLLQGGVIQPTQGHVIPCADILAKKTYCKWHDSYTHTINECNCFQ
jgi:hypothetical protein